MPDPSISAALAEAYASAPADVVVFHTLEFWHPSWSAPIRVVRDHAALDARIEAGAERNAGEVVTFSPFPFSLDAPELSSTGVPQVGIEIDNVSREIAAAIDAAVMAGQPTTIIYRAYLADTALSGPEYTPMHLTLQTAQADAQRVRLTAGWPDLLNLRFPKREYDSEDWPGLAP